MMNLFKGLYLLLALVCSVGQAAQLRDLYQADVLAYAPATSQHAANVESALRAVLVKVSGNPKIADLESVKQQLSGAKKLVQQYSYRNNKNTDGKTQTYLWVRFNPRGVNSLLQQSGQAIWGAERPLLVSWIAVRDHKGSSLINNDNSATAQLFSQLGKQRGLITLLPVMDLEDINEVQFTDVWQTKVPTLRQASKRYGSNNILIANIQELAEDQWQGSWTLILRGERFSWPVKGATLSDAMQQGVANVTETLAARYAILETGAVAREALVKVDHISDVNAYARVLKYLKGLAPVEDVSIVSVDPSAVIYKVSLSGNMHALTQTIALGSMLQPELDTAAELRGELLYHLMS